MGSRAVDLILVLPIYFGPVNPNYKESVLITSSRFVTSRKTVILLMFFAFLLAGRGASAKNNSSQKAAARQSRSQAATVANLKVKRVLLLGIDGMHAVDLENFVRANPQSTLAKLKNMAYTYTSASTSRPSDSFPGILAMTTGGSPYSGGVFYEISYDRALSPPDSKCATKGTEVALDETIDIDPDGIEGGGGVNPDKLPKDGSKGCSPVYPHDLLRVNTIFEVIKAAGMRTAWCDKQPAYEIVNGPSGHGVDDLYTPELHHNASSKSMEKIEAFDDLRLKAILNEIDGKDHTGAHDAPVPAILGMTFQAFTVGEKLKAGMGYTDNGRAFSPALQGALEFTDNAIGKIVKELDSRGLLSSTAIILTAKHGQSPMDVSKKEIVDESIIPGIIDGVQKGLAAEVTGDDLSLIWLKDQSRTEDVVTALNAHSKEAHIRRVLSGESVKLLFRDPLKDSRSPDIVVLPDFGVIYTKPTNGTIAEHGGFNEEDLNVPLLVANPAISAEDVHTSVQTTQIAPTILKLLGLSPSALQAVQIEKTRVLPGF